MNRTYRNPVLAGIATLVFMAAGLSMAAAQETSRGTVAVYPVVYSRDSGTDTGRAAGVRTVKEILERSGFTLISSSVAADAWHQLGYERPITDGPLKVDDMARFARQIHARYVVSPVFDFDSRSIWVGLGPKTVSTATVSIRIFDVDQNKVVYNRSEIKGRSDERDSALKAVADVLVTPLVTIVSGGPKAPHEERAAQIAAARAMRPWVRKTE